MWINVVAVIIAHFVIGYILLDIMMYLRTRWNKEELTTGTYVIFLCFWEIISFFAAFIILGERAGS